MQMVTQEAPSAKDIIAAHQADVWRYLRVLGCEPATADDLTQETFLTILRKPFEYRSAGEMKAYLRTVAKNRFLMALRAQRVRRAAMSEDELTQAWERVAGADDERYDSYLDALRLCMETIEPRMKESLEMQHSGHAPMKNIAEHLGTSIGNAKTMLYRARLALRACIEKKVGI
ncbi:MAG: RNA polymerase sigma factor [Planctomycetes bacterium]|nr:RNA polymerase sigma factor [Planctomycetota bacterium]NUQ33441.1 RNA polymerase sigma factor [Planctomycetaceae bacterium]